MPPCPATFAAAAPTTDTGRRDFLKVSALAGGDNRITILVDRSETGQGVYTALPMLLAEELEVPLTAIAVEAAPPGPAYVSQAIGVQITGGSTPVRAAWNKLRQAGAAARVVVVQAAATEWGVDVAE